jgi:hypothetical protein
MFAGLGFASLVALDSRHSKQKRSFFTPVWFFVTTGAFSHPLPLQRSSLICVSIIACALGPVTRLARIAGLPCAKFRVSFLAESNVQPTSAANCNPIRGVKLA